MRIVAAADFEAGALAACFTAAFDGYLAGSFVMDAASLPRFLARQGADPALSRCVVDDAGALLGLCFVGEFARRRRVGGMGLLPAARGTGAARGLLRQVVDEARDAGCDAVELEVFAQNEPAARLYRSEGFVELAPLWGFERAPAPLPVAADVEPQPVDIDGAARWLVRHGHPDLPYQVSGHALARSDPASTLWRTGQGLMQFAPAGPDRLAVGLLNDLHPSQQDAGRLLAALIARHPGHTIRAPQLMREDVAGRAFRQLGFVPLPLHQLQMRKVLSG
jgi:GNAT superfamily N-acetyltransferase